MTILYFVFSAIIGAALMVGWIGWMSEYHQRKILERRIEELREDLWKAERKLKISENLKNIITKKNEEVI